MIKLSILIATMPSRQREFDQLLEFLLLQRSGKYDDTVEIITNSGMDCNIGAKRNKLLNSAIGDYIVYIDDDDLVSHNYIQKIIDATENKPDCIGISGTITFNGGNRKQWHISKEYGHWYEQNNIYYRTPNHISPVKRELALQAGFPEISFGEDAEYSSRLLPLLKTEVIITGDLYEYRYVKK